MKIERNKWSPEDTAAVKSAWGSQGYSCGLWVDPPGQVWSDFVHDTDELVTVLVGRLDVEVDGCADSLSPGDELYIPAHKKHTVRNVGGTTARWLFGYRRTT